MEEKSSERGLRVKRGKKTSVTDMDRLGTGGKIDSKEIVRVMVQ